MQIPWKKNVCLKHFANSLDENHSHRDNDSFFKKECGSHKITSEWAEKKRKTRKRNILKRERDEKVIFVSRKSVSKWDWKIIIINWVFAQVVRKEEANSYAIFIKIYKYMKL